MFSVPAATRRGYPVANSVVLDKTKSTNLNRTPIVASAARLWTYSAWVKRGALNTSQFLLATYNVPNQHGLEFQTDGTLNFYLYITDTYVARLVTSAAYNDVSSHMHIVVVYDTENAINSERQRIYVDGVRVTDFTTEIYTTSEGHINFTTEHRIGSFPNNSLYLDAYMSQTVMIDGQALTPDSFGQFIGGKWLPKDVSGLDYSGINSFYLPFTDPLNIGKDASGNGNDWLATNLTPDSVVTDTPTNNCCTWNPVWQGVQAIYSDGNRDSEASAISKWKKSQGTFAFPSSGKWYFEVTCVWVGNAVGVGIATSDPDTAKGILYLLNGKIVIDGVDSNYGSSFTTGALIGIAYDADNNTLQFFNDGIAQPILSDIYIDTFFPNHANLSSSLGSKLLAHFNEDEFTYAPPEGFNALMEKYL